MKSHARIAVVTAGAALLAGCATLGFEEDHIGSASPDSGPALADPTGPAGDYPVVIGPAYTVNGVTYAPEDALNYDEVGYAIRDTGAGQGITAAHHTLPLPSYVEVTELGEGRTALVRVERRGPMNGNQLLALSADAMAQLGIQGNTPVRVRRVNPPEAERAKLRMGERAPMRIETPSGLLTVLRRQLPSSEGTAVIRPTPVETPAEKPAPDRNASPAPDETAPAQPAPATAGYYVQAGAYSEQARADRVAAQLNGKVYPAGRLWRVRSGPFANAADAERDLARIRAAGYRDARVVREN